MINLTAEIKKPQFDCQMLALNQPNCGSSEAPAFGKSNYGQMEAALLYVHTPLRNSKEHIKMITKITFNLLELQPYN